MGSCLRKCFPAVTSSNHEDSEISGDRRQTNPNLSKGQIKEWNIQLRSNKLFTDEIGLMDRSKRFNDDWKVDIVVQTCREIISHSFTGKAQFNKIERGGLQKQI